MTVKPIVVGIDGSAPAVRAVVWAAREATLRGVPLRIVSAPGLLPRMRVPAHAGGVETVSGRLSREHERALASAASAAAAVAPGLPVETATLDGAPAQAVAHSGSQAQLLVVGSHVSSAFAGITLGSVSRYAAVRASCPVVVVRETPAGAHRLVVVGIRATEDCRAALAFAFEEASLRKAPLRAVYAWQAPDPRAVSAQAELADLLDDWNAKYPEVEASSDVVPGDPGRVLAGLSARAGLVVVGRHDTDGWLVPGPARAVQAVVSHARGPVVIVPPARA
jgi:nucleotide-binding universal stress UspA family protein